MNFPFCFVELYFLSRLSFFLSFIHSEQLDLFPYFFFISLFHLLHYCWFHDAEPYWFLFHPDIVSWYVFFLLFFFLNYCLCWSCAQIIFMWRIIILMIQQNNCKSQCWMSLLFFPNHLSLERINIFFFLFNQPWIGYVRTSIIHETSIIHDYVSLLSFSLGEFMFDLWSNLNNFNVAIILQLHFCTSVHI